MRQALCIIYSPLRLAIILVASPILTLVYWLMVVIGLIPLYLFRKLVSFIAHLVDPDLCKIVNSMGHIISRDYPDWFRSPSHTVTVIFKLKGSDSVTLDEARQLFLQRLVHRTLNSNHDQLEYPEMQQYFTKRWGYLFFKWDRSFDISNHINMYSHKELLPKPETDWVNEATLMKIWETIMIKPLMEKRSPWDVHLIPNYVPPKTTEKGEGKQSVIILRVHHALCDGASIYKLLLTLTDDGLVNLEKDIAAFKKAPAYLGFIIHLKAFICGPTSVIQKFSKGFDNYNPLHRPLGKKTGRGHIVKTTFDLQTIKNIARVHMDVSFHSVLIAALAGGMRNYLLGNGHKIPISPIRLALPIPKPGHSYKLRNEYFVSLIDLPVEKKTSKQRLFAIEKRLNSLKTESFMPFMSQSWQILGLFPAQVSRLLTLKSAITVTYSEIKGPAKLLTVLDGKYELLDLVYSFGLGPDDLGVALNSISYNGKIHIVLSLDHGITKTKDKAQQFLNLIEKELDELQYGDSTNL